MSVPPGSIDNGGAPASSHTSAIDALKAPPGENDDAASASANFGIALRDVSATVDRDREDNGEKEAQQALFRELLSRSEARIEKLFGQRKEDDIGEFQEDGEEVDQPAHEEDTQMTEGTLQAAPPPTRARVLDADDEYGDFDEDDEGEADQSIQQGKERAHPLSPSKSGSSPADNQSDKSPVKASTQDKDEGTQQPKSSEDVRKQLEADKKATEDLVKRNFNSYFYTLENDRIAMLEQAKLEESEKQIESEMGNNAVAGAEQHGSLSTANLGASSLTLKHLIARIDQKRDMVKASDAELRSLMNEVRKNRSKWASEESVGQEELYEAAEKVLTELKAMTEYSQPFLTRVNKREAPDYYNIIKQPMDLGSMTKKLKSLAYKSKEEFVKDLNLIWDNCLKYNADVAHPLRRNANNMRKEADKLIPLIPDIVVRSRAEVEAEERRKQAADGEDADESDDEPIMQSRGRKAPGNKGAKGTAKARKSIPGHKEGTPADDHKPPLPINRDIAQLAHEGSDFGADGSQNGFVTPGGPAGSGTPLGAHGSQADLMDLDGPSLNGISFGQALSAAAEEMEDDEEYKIWKQVTKKDRARVARERHKLFKGDKLNPDEPALLRTKAGMRRWIREHQESLPPKALADVTSDSSKSADKEASKVSETLAEGMEGTEEERALPDYYDPLSAIPDIDPKLQWIEDSEGQNAGNGDFLRMIPQGYFTAPASKLTTRIEANMRQMQETRKICSKIGVVKQMQLQTQMYNNQFQKYDPEPFAEQDIEPHAVTDDGPVMVGSLCRAALQRSVGKLCYHAGFEELQPSALDVITDIAADYFEKITRTFGVYREAPKVPAVGEAAKAGLKWQERFTNEEIMLHTLSENGIGVEELEAYVKDDVERFGNKLSIQHERMKSHLTDLLRPALSNDAGADGVGAFNDGSDQFVAGDFAEDIDEDFFGFKELGLDKEFGLATLSVPLHLLQSRVHNAHNLNNPAAGPSAAALFPPLPPLPPVTTENIHSQIGLVKNFFLAKLHANEDQPLVEDEDLPAKQRFPKPRLPPTGKITSPRKRPLKEQQLGTKKKKKLDGPEMDAAGPGKGKPGSPEKKRKGPIPKSEREAAENAANATDANGNPDGANGLQSQPMERTDTMGTTSFGEDADGELDPDADADADADPDVDMDLGMGMDVDFGDTSVANANGAKKSQMEAEGGMMSPESIER